MNMRLTVIVTTYNRPDALVKVLRGLGVQTRLPDEVIIADDGSTRPTRDAVAAFRRDAPYPLEHVRQEDRGFRASRIRNQAILAATGDYVILFDGDCIPDAHFVSDHARLAEPGRFFQGKRVLVSEALSPGFDHTTLGGSPWRHLFSGQLGNKHHLVRMPGWPATTSTRLSGIRSCNMGFFREDIFAVNGFNEDFVGWGREDSELAVRFYRYGLKRKEHLFLAICFHLWHDENDRRHLAANDDILARTIASDQVACSNGLVKDRVQAPGFR